MSDSLIGTEYFPNVYFEEVKVFSVAGDDPTPSKSIEAKICLFDTFPGTWSKNDDFFNSLEVIITTIEHEEIFQQCQNGDLPNFMFPSRHHVIKSIAEFDKKVVTFENLNGTYTKFYYKITGLDLRVDSDPLEIKNYQKTFGLLAAAGMSKTNLSDSYNMDLKFHTSPSVEDVTILLQPGANNRGPVIGGNLITTYDNDSGETRTYSNNMLNYFTGPCRMQMVKKDGQFLFAKKSHIFYEKETQNIWNGPVHMNGDEYMAGSFHLSDAQPLLDRMSIDTNILVDNTNEEIEYQNTSTLSSGYGRFKDFHQEDILEDINRNVNNTCILDMQSMLATESYHGNLILSNDPETFREISENTNIKDIEVKRYPINNLVSMNRIGLMRVGLNLSSPTLIARSQNNHQTIKEKTLLKSPSSKFLSVNPKRITNRSLKREADENYATKDLIENSVKIGKIQQINLSLPKNLRTVNFTDYDISTAKPGRYKYQVSVTMGDEPYLYCKNLLKEAIGYHKKISNLFSVLEMKNVWKEDHYDSSFISDFYSQYGMTQDVGDSGLPKLSVTDSYKESYLTLSYDTLYRIEKLLGIKNPRSTNQYKNFLNLFLTSPEKLNILIKYYENCIDRFRRNYRLTDGEGYEKSSSKKRKDRGTIQKTIALDKEYKKEVLKPIGINFITPNTNLELTRISPSFFNTRANNEIKKFFNGTIGTNNEELMSLPESVRADFSNLEKNKYMSFSPSKIFFGGKELDTSEINPESFDAEFYKGLRIAKSLFSGESTEEEIIPNEESIEEELIDSREFLGEETKFNRAFLANVNNINKLTKIRRTFPILENRILKQNRSNLSLQSFEVSNPQSLLFKKVKTEAAKIPMQIKALSLLRTNLTKFDVSSLGFDPLSNPQTQEVFEQNYLNLGTVKVLEGFEMKNGIMNLSNPIYSEIDSRKMEMIGNKRMLCRVEKLSYDNLTAKNNNFNVFDSVFVMESENSDDSGLFIGDQEVQQTSLSPSGPQEIIQDLPVMQEAPEAVQLDLNNVLQIEIQGEITFANFRSQIITQHPNNAGPLMDYNLEQYTDTRTVPSLPDDALSLSGMNVEQVTIQNNPITNTVAEQVTTYEEPGDY